MRSQGGVNRLFSIGLLLICGSLSLAGEPNGLSIDISSLKPGKEISLTFEEHKIVIYLPLDYNDINEAPAIFFYHGQGGHPNVNYFRHMTDSNGFIIVGMSYANEPKSPVRKGRYINYIKGEVKRLGKLKRYLERELHLRIDKRKLFITGISKGGWFTSRVFDYNPRPWAGAVIIAAGRRTTLESSEKKSFKGKLIYIGAGEKDANRPAAERAKTFYSRKGAEVTLEIYKGLGHAANPNAVLLRKWLKDLTQTTETD